MESNLERWSRARVLATQLKAVGFLVRMENPDALAHTDDEHDFVKGVILKDKTFVPLPEEGPI